MRDLLSLLDEFPVQFFLVKFDGIQLMSHCILQACFLGSIDLALSFSDGRGQNQRSFHCVVRLRCFDLLTLS